MAGRNISVTREGMGPVRVMRTCGMMGEIVGKAAWIAVRHGTTPRGVYQAHLALLQDLMRQPGALRRDSLAGSLTLPPGAKVMGPSFAGLNPASLEGVVIDDEAARFTGQWESGGGLSGYVADGYHYTGDASAVARFPVRVSASGFYEVRLAWQPHPNRAKAARVEVVTPAGTEVRTVDQTQAARGVQGFESLGVFRFEAGRPAEVVLRVANARGIVHADAVQLVPAKGPAPGPR
jgi:hypothetical protein